MRLNLGCGERVFDGDDWLNVDLAEEGPPRVRYTQLDIAKALPFAADHFDEIFSCHVIEHFWPWEITSILREWVRVLKPSGIFIVECPNVHGAAMMICEAEKQKSPDLWAEAMKAFYGDPKDKALPQRHKWGYSPRTLGRLLEIVGLDNIRQEPAQFKMREPRDMRIVAEKPK